MAVAAYTVYEGSSTASAAIITALASVSAADLIIIPRAGGAGVLILNEAEA